MSKKKAKTKKTNKYNLKTKDLISALKFYEYFNVPMSLQMRALRKRLDAGEKATEADFELYKDYTVNAIAKSKHPAFQDEIFDDMRVECTRIVNRKKKKRKKS
jgi:hypothetical protein